MYAGDRVKEYRMKLEGATYMDIHKIGGGIGFTVRHVAQTLFFSSPVMISSEDDLFALTMPRLMTMLKHGTTYPPLLFP